MEAASPIDDVRSSAVYRREMVHNLALRGLEQVWVELEMKDEKSDRSLGDSG